MDKEIWKDIVGYEGLYQVSNLGNVKSTKRQGTKGNELIKSTTKDGYDFVSLYKNGKSKSSKIHTLVGKAFIDNPNNYNEINHKDGNKQNNCVDNLEWCTHQQNVLHRYRVLNH